MDLEDPLDLSIKRIWCRRHFAICGKGGTEASWQTKLRAISSPVVDFTSKTTCAKCRRK
jgi:hypothetical protein